MNIAFGPGRNCALQMTPLQKAQVLTQRRKAAKMLKKVFDYLENDQVTPSFSSHVF
jgi:propanediol dehydratase large subunit